METVFWCFGVSNTADSTEHKTLSQLHAGHLFLVFTALQRLIYFNAYFSTDWLSTFKRSCCLLQVFAWDAPAVKVRVVQFVSSLHCRARSTRWTPEISPEAVRVVAQYHHNGQERSPKHHMPWLDNMQGPVCLAEEAQKFWTRAARILRPHKSITDLKPRQLNSSMLWKVPNMDETSIVFVITKGWRVKWTLCALLQKRDLVLQ